MSQLRRLVVFLIAASALMALWASSAFAEFTLTETKCETGTIATLCDATTEKGATLVELSGTEKLLVKGGEAEFEVKSLELALLAKSVVGSGVEASQTKPLVEPYSLKGILEFLEVTITSEPLKKECVVANPVKTLTLSATEETDGFLSIKPSTGGTFAELTFTNKEKEKCPATVFGTNPVTGSIACPIAEGGVDLLVHKLTCAKTEAETQLLRFGGGAATIAGTLEAETELGLFISTQLG